MYTLKLRSEFGSLLSPRFNVIELNAVMDIPTETTDILLIDGNSVDVTEVYEAVEQSQAKCIYITKGRSDSLSAMASAIGMELLDEDAFPKWVEQQNPVSKAPILTFWGVLPQEGTTTMTLSVAMYLQREYDVNVGVLGLNLYDPGDWVLQEPTRYLDDILTFLQARKLTPEQLPDLMDTFDRSGVKYLCGNRSQGLALHYSLADIQYLIDVATETFDVVLIDAGAVLNTAAAVQAMVSGQLYAVMTDRLYAERRLTQQMQSILRPLGIDANEVLLVGNKMDKPKALASFAKSTGTMPMVAFPDRKPTALLNEQTADPLKWVLEEKTFQKEFRKIAQSVAAANDLKKKETIAR